VDGIDSKIGIIGPIGGARIIDVGTRITSATCIMGAIGARSYTRGR
jgi:hypothetical protein